MAAIPTTQRLPRLAAADPIRIGYISGGDADAFVFQVTTNIEEVAAAEGAVMGTDMTAAAAAIGEHASTHPTHIVVDPSTALSKVVSSAPSELVDALLEIEGDVAVVVDRAGG